jgi:5-methylcytosine-specific restriction endonuclease McrA
MKRTVLRRKKGLNPVSKKQLEKNRCWSRIVAECLIRENSTCQYCHRRGRRHDFWNPLEGHHAVPRSRGGENTHENCYIVHHLCHQVITDNNIDVREYDIGGRIGHAGDITGE